MSSPVTNRIVGTLVLLALLALIVPELLKEPAAPTPEKFEVIPLRPELGSTPPPATYPKDALATTEQPPQAKPLPDDNIPAGEAASGQTAAEQPKASQPQPATEQAKVETKPKTAPAPLPAKPKPVSRDAWVVQMGAFGNHQSADSLVQKLRSSGYKAFLVEEKGLSKVLVGPELDKGRLEGQLDKLNKLTGLKGRVFQYDPLQ
ncbi:SPOR domain-containing protein [Gallaecimonas kandeliae]|uniref:SPOR domain-containing protein n=1 Tax=Gallaecimonas kandeliae TaxID=3029055 RepID=UPI0026497472|nr:SPOR domain-containing protein [Gallaecimonas kandeliae]WKE64158.1 SPOR domain-containing protein [Gallaecimonas kandeliae]